MVPINTPRSLDLNITNNCNLRCLYCAHFSSARDSGEDLSTEEWLNFFRELKQCAILNVSVSGGEPLLRKDFKKLINGIVINRMRFSVASNGTLIDDETVKYLKSTERCNNFQVSIDGSGLEEHEACRGEETFEKALAGLKCLIKHKMPTTVRVTIHKYNFKSLDKIAELLLDDIGLPFFSTNSASHMGLCRENKDNIQLTVDEYSEAMARLLNLDKKYKGRITATAGPLASAKLWREIEETKKKNKKNLPGCGHLRGCGGVFTGMAILANGVMVPCSLLSHINLGRINKDSLRDIWMNHPELKKLRDRQNIPLSEFEYCKGCDYVSYCGGGCPALAYTITGNENKPSLDVCYRAFLQAGGKLPEIDY